MRVGTDSPPLARGRTVAYWATTLLVAAELGVGGVWDILRTPFVRSIIDKIPGAVVLLIPRRPRLKEWAYAGFVFTMTGAVASHLAVGDGASALIAPVTLLALALASWALRAPPRRL